MRFSIVTAALLALAVTQESRRPLGAALVTVIDGSGASLSDLSAVPLTIMEDGHVRDVVSVRPSTDVPFVSVLVDTANSGVDVPIPELRRGLSDFVRTFLGAEAGAQIALWDFGGRPAEVVAFTTDPAALGRGINRLVRASSSTAVFETIVAASREMDAVSSPRRALIIVSVDSVQTDSTAADRAAQSVRSAGVTVWAIQVARGADLVAFSKGTDLGGHLVRTPPSTGAALDEFLERIAQATGGLRFTIRQANALPSALERVAQHLDAQQEVRFARPSGTPSLPLVASAGKGLQVLVAPWVR